jgi:hypothetical protein
MLKTTMSSNLRKT